MIEAQPPAGEQSSPYLPAGPPDPLIFEAFEGINTATLRPGVDDKEAAWLDCFMPLGPGRNLRTMYDVGPALFTPSDGDTIVFFDFFNISTTPYMLAITTGGEIYAVNTNTGVSSSIAPPGTITNPVRTGVGLSQYGSQYVQIVAQQTNGYWIWDGTTFYVPGGPLPPGTAGSSGLTTMPLAISGSTIENYLGRTWIGNNATITFSAPGSLIDFSSAHGGGNFTSTDSFLRVQFVGLKQTNGFLYLIADSSVNYISGVQTSGSPPVTTFTNQNADPEVGSPWPATIDVFNRNILFANAFGAQVSYGGAVTKISEKLDGVYNTVPNFGNITPSAGKAIIFGKKCWILLLPIIDPISGQQVNKMFLWNGKIWWAAMQSVPLIYIQHQEINSVLTTYGTNGLSVYPLFAQPSTALTKIAQTKLWDKPGGYQFTKFVTRFWGIVKYYSGLSPTLNVAIDNETSSNTNAVTAAPSPAVWTMPSGAISTWTTVGGSISTWLAGGAGSYSVLAPEAVAGAGVLTGFTVTTNTADMAIVTMMIHDEVAGYRG
jgi:hypothetical protein